MRCSVVLWHVVRVIGYSALLLTVSGTAAAEPELDYARDVKPLLEQFCIRCHGPEEQNAGLRVDSRSGLLTGGNSGPALDAQHPAESRLLQAIARTDDELAMPPEGEPQLDATALDVLKRWILAGAPAPADAPPPAAAARTSDHWSFQAVIRPPLPAAAQHPWTRTPIDAFILARLEQEQLDPAPEADRATLMRRVSLDLTGLPPTPAEVDAFLTDARPDAYEQLVERLLASPHYGERWGRHWLDLARYADSNGYTRDMPRDIWMYRQWVIEALNRNLSFRQFVIEQIAGDMLPGADWSQRVATGFHRNTLFNEEGGTDPEQFRVERTVDRVNTTGSVFLGLTIGCAQCHDHKYDPLSQREYYQLFAYFNSADEPVIDVPSPEQIARGDVERRAQIRARIAELQQQFEAQREAYEKFEIAWEAQLTEEQKKQLPFQVLNAINLIRAERTEELNRHLYEYFDTLPATREHFPLLDEIHQLKQQEPQFVRTMVMQQRGEPRETFVHLRGDFLSPGVAVQPATPAVLPKLEASAEAGDRLDLARWLVDDRNPLTPRVTMNRLWQQYFGRGLVETENDFGRQGSRPSHPELLDWLADEFVTSGWDLKAMHRLIVRSAVYRQSSVQRGPAVDKDPNNLLLARQARLRLDSELIRDSALATSGLLAHRLGGPSVYPPQPDGVFDFTQDKKPWPTATGSDRYRRALYTFLWRSSPYPAMSVFDFPDANVTCTRRIRSNTPLQSLTLANDQTFVEFARGLGERLCREATGDEQRLHLAMRLALCRPPSEAELSRLAEFVAAQRAQLTADPDAASVLTASTDDESADPAERIERAVWTRVARVIFNLDEFITRE